MRYLRGYLAFALTLASPIVAQAQYGENEVPVLQDSAKVERLFPPVNSTQLLSPAFQSPRTVPSQGFANGTEGPTSLTELDYFVRSIAERNSYMTYRSADFTSEEGRSFPYVYLSDQNSNGTLSSSPDKLRVWIQGGVHGNEPAGDQSLLALLGKMDANQTWASSLLERMDIMILFRYNPDGVAYFQRTLATNFDPNRDHMKLARQQTRDIKMLFNSFDAHIAADMHEFGATYLYGPNENLVQASDALFAAAKNLNIHEDIRNMSEGLFATQIGDELEGAGFRWEPYATEGETDDESVLLFEEADGDARIGRNAMGLTQAISFLFEVRGIALADQEFQRRTACALTMVQSLLQTVADNADEVLSTITTAREDFISSVEDIVVTDIAHNQNRTWSMIDIRNATLIQQPIEFASTTPKTANLTRARPEAYLIPRAWIDVAQRLEILGLEVQRLEYGYSGNVEALNITSSVLDDEYYEGVVLATVTTRSVQRHIQLPPGSFWVSTSQNNAALAFNVLEPENIDSYVTFGIVPLYEGDEYPIFRVVA
ncbi:hypothetical protein LTR37_012971 [Vermiconidia calcicola]|uniref:Uncharacterized protein n=1 Tax=Vermiconidia calcicola TaxID=1690605 RepID=A0ACC3MXM2_9PEZI|nr:hypothetical protein LTR37_012971 [Vermiconidia calcicola]